MLHSTNAGLIDVICVSQKNYLLSQYLNADTETNIYCVTLNNDLLLHNSITDKCQFLYCLHQIFITLSSIKCHLITL